MSVSVFAPKRVESRHSDRTGRTLEEPRTCPEPHTDLAEVAVRWDDGPVEDVLTDDLRFLGERDIPEDPYRRTPEDLIEGIATTLRTMTPRELAERVAPVARGQYRELTPGDYPALGFWHLLDALAQVRSDEVEAEGLAQAAEQTERDAEVQADAEAGAIVDQRWPR